MLNLHTSQSRPSVVFSFIHYDIHKDSPQPAFREKPGGNEAAGLVLVTQHDFHTTESETNHTHEKQAVCDPLSSGHGNLHSSLAVSREIADEVVLPSDQLDLIVPCLVHFGASRSRAAQIG